MGGTPLGFASPHPPTSSPPQACQNSPRKKGFTVCVLRVQKCLQGVKSSGSSSGSGNIQCAKSEKLYKLLNM